MYFTCDNDTLEFLTESNDLTLRVKPDTYTASTAVENIVIHNTSATLNSTADLIVLVSTVDNGSIAIDLPASPRDKQRITFKDYGFNCFNQLCLIDGNGKDVDDSTMALIDSDGGFLTVMFVQALNKWLVIY